MYQDIIIKAPKIKKTLKKYFDNNHQDINFIINVLQGNITNDSEYREYFITLEEILSTKINECFENPNFKNLPISLIYRVIDQSNKFFLNSNLLCTFILESLEERHILLYFIDIKNLSSQCIDNLYTQIVCQDDPKIKSYLQFLPFHFDYIKNIMNKDKIPIELNNKYRDPREIIRYENDLNYSKITEFAYQTNNFHILQNVCQMKNHKTITEKNSLILTIENNDYDLVRQILQGNYEDLLYLEKVENEHHIIYKITEKSALHIAVEIGNIEIVKLLLNSKKIIKNRICIEKINNENESAIIESYKTELCVAIEKNNYEIIELLLKDPNIYEYNSYEKITRSYETDKNLYKKEYKTPIHFAVENEDFVLLDLVKRYYKFDVNSYYKIIYPSENREEKETPLFIALRLQNNEMFKKLLEIDSIDVNAKKIIKTINQNGNEVVNKDECPILIEAIQKENIEIIRLLLEFPEIDINASYINANYHLESEFGLRIQNEIHLLMQNFLLMIFDEYNSNKMLKNSIIYPGKGDISIHSSLLAAISVGNIEIINLLLNHPKIDVNIEDKNAYISVYSEYIDINSKNALIKAIDEQNIEVIRALLQKPNINANYFLSNIFSEDYIKKKDPKLCYKATIPLLNAVLLKNSEIVELLLQNSQVDVNCKVSKYSKNYEIEDDGNSPLHLAVKLGNLEIIMLLLSHNGIDVNIKNDKNEKPINLTTNEQIIEVLNSIII